MAILLLDIGINERMYVSTALHSLPGFMNDST
jgi:hypothetical protein